MWDILTIACRNKEAFLKLMEYTPDYFIGDQRIVFESMRKIHEIEQEPDLRFIYQVLCDKGKKKLADEFSNHYKESPAIFNFKPLLSRLEDDCWRRNLLATVDQIRDGIKGKIQTDQLQELVGILTRGEKKADEIQSIKELAKSDVLEIYSDSFFYKTKIEEIDSVFQGFFICDMTVIAASPGMGKTSLALQIANNIPDTLFVSCEMPKRQLYSRMLCSRSGVESWRIMSGVYRAGELEKVRAANKFYQETTSLSVIDNKSNINDILNVASRYVETGRCKHLVIDYIQRLSGGQGISTNDKVASISKKVKDFAVEYQIPVTVLSQLSRESRKDKRRPELTDLRDSGAVEQDADRVIFIYQEDGIFKFYFAKNRNGRTDIVNTSFEKERFLFGTIPEKFVNPEYFRN